MLRLIKPAYETNHMIHSIKPVAPDCSLLVLRLPTGMRNPPLISHTPLICLFLTAGVALAHSILSVFELPARTPGEEEPTSHDRGELPLQGNRTGGNTLTTWGVLQELQHRERQHQKSGGIPLHYVERTPSTATPRGVWCAVGFPALDQRADSLAGPKPETSRHRTDSF